MGEPEHLDAVDAARRAREEMYAVTQSLRALLEDLRGDEDELPRVVRTPGSAPSP